MRSNVTISGLLALLTICLPAAADNGGVSVTLTSPQFGGKAAVSQFKTIWDPNLKLEFEVTTPNGFTVQSISLKAWEHDKPITSQTHDGQTNIGPRGILFDREDPPFTEQDILKVNDKWTTATVSGNIAKLVQEFLQYQDLALYLECEWVNSDPSLFVRVKSTSRFFAFYDITSEPSIAEGNIGKAKNYQSLDAPAVAETTITSAPTTSMSAGSPEPTEQPPTTTQQTTSPLSVSSDDPSLSSISTPATLATIRPTATPTHPANESKNRLSMGATIGIAVGVSLAGVLAIGLLVWFLCRRRRRSGGGVVRHRGMPSYSSDLGARDKEMPGVRLESTSRQSGYGGAGDDDDEDEIDNGRTRGVGGAAAAVVGGGAEQRHYAPYSDRNTTTTTTTNTTTTTSSPQYHHLGTSPDDAGNPIQQGQGPPVVSSRYAHLVEEGMTDDEIRRLEEEERQLDAAIEENVGRRGGS